MEDQMVRLFIDNRFKVVREDDYYLTGVLALAEPIPGEEHDIVVSRRPRTDRRNRRYCRPVKPHNGKVARSKK